ncbi:hypothetical protein AKJ65_00750 [candidate division MSBL1 archaeon SCGC-AAA259E19]|uniref:Uncharacterized protein n=2 Tax=candidate division MSBL1 TaxID=215777 RepID=A0A133UEM8_9EURY|nr:hypothetical protein AKJ64_02685 [candidate division MSBL1 archaeon SCGC-AAA259E17]KXA95781.1 hypothetical protein AKJ65_00750 [candidate division MSBL1 archaeon SCGC-AAA259E19]
MEEVEREDVEYVQLQFTNVEGKLKSMTVHVSQIGEAIDEGLGFDGSSVTGYADVEESDLVLMPDLETFQILPWKSRGKSIARLFCTVCYPNGEPHEADPRNVLDTYLRTWEKEGYTFFVGSEIEFYLLKNGNPIDDGGYLDSPPNDKAEKHRTEMAIDLRDLGFTVEKIHHEVSSGQNELDFRYSDALTTADNIIACRQALKTLGRERGLDVNYEPKPIPDGMGNGLHCHHSLGDSKTGQNLFYDPGGKYRMSDLARHFLGGELVHAPALTALAASAPNSYDRLVPGYEAPVYVSWGGPNRTVMTRTPGYEVRSGSGMRFEYRTPDPLCNPYLLFTGLLAAGMDGVDRELDPGPPASENIFEMTEEERESRGITILPDSLHKALDALHADDVIRGALGEKMTETYIDRKREESFNC